MIDKIKALFKKIRRFFSIERCYTEMEQRGISAMGCCSGIVGGDKTTDYLQYQCVGCKYNVPVQTDISYEEKTERFITWLEETQGITLLNYQKEMMREILKKARDEGKIYFLT